MRRKLNLSGHGACYLPGHIFIAQEIVKPQRQAPSTDQLVSGAVAVLEKVPVAAFSLADLLLSHCAQKPEREEAVMACLLDRLAPAGAAPPAAQPAEGTLLATAHLLAVLCDASPAMRLAGVRRGGLSLLHQPSHTVRQPAVDWEASRPTELHFDTRSASRALS